MNMLGKIITLMIVIMSVIFCSLSVMVYATHKNWEQVARKAVADLQAAQRSNANLVRENEEVKNELAKERAYRAFQVAQNTSKATSAQEEVAQLSTKNRTIATQLAEMGTEHDLTNAANNFLTAENDRLMKSKVGVENDLIRHQELVIKLNDEYADQRGKNDSLTEENRMLAMTVADQKYVLDDHGLTKDSVTDEPPKLDGVITAVHPTLPLVEISLGSDDGLKQGHRLEVFRGNSYLGRIVIRETTPNRAVGAIVPELQRDKFQRGDRVATKLG